jgi:Carboxypeptidase regulatory-like domain
MQPVRIAAVIFAITSLPACLLAQNASINGQVVDAQQARVPASTVTLTNVDTKVTVQSTSDGSGTFILPPVDPGHCDLQAKAPGFAATVLTGITLETGESKVVKIVLAREQSNRSR